MIAFLRGVVSEKTEVSVVLDVGGVGYSVAVSSEVHGALTTGQEAHITVYEHIKEDAHDLYGFLDKPSKTLFEKLISVNGVGPKMGLNIMNVGNSSDLIQAISGGDLKYIQAASGVGKKVAERIVVDLKDKLGVSASEGATDFLAAPSSVVDEAMQALIALGFTNQDAATALAGIDTEMDVEDRIKAALSKGHK